MSICERGKEYAKGELLSVDGRATLSYRVCMCQHEMNIRAMCIIIQGKCVYTPLKFTGIAI